MNPSPGAAASGLAQHDPLLAQARAFAEPLLADEVLDTGEGTLAHAEAVSTIVRAIGGSVDTQAAAWLLFTCDHLNKPQEVLAKRFGASLAALAMSTTQLVRLQRQALASQADDRTAFTAVARALPQPEAQQQTENVRKMLLAFSRDLRVVMLRLASRLQTLRWYAASKRPISPALARDSLQVFAPLANRLGIWELKWELEDLAFRFLEPDTYREVARLLEQKRVDREQQMANLRARLEHELRDDGIAATVQGRPKHIYSIVKKMRGKGLGFENVYDIRALRVIVASVEACYQALSSVHNRFVPVGSEFDDYIARPKSNGYQSLHTVVRDGDGKALEIQIRTQWMHDHAEHGVAAHWAYKEAGAKGYAGVSASGDYDAKISVLRQLLAWQRDISGETGGGIMADHIYVLTPDAAIVELPQGATPLDFAYTLHTELGHRCRGARVDGAMVPLNTALANGQTVEINAAKEGGPSRDWLNADLGFLASHRARAKVRAWFNARALHETIARGREAVEKLLQREGKTAVNQVELASRLGFDSPDALFEVVGKDEFSLRNIENVLRPPEPAAPVEDAPLIKRPRAPSKGGGGGVLVVGVDSLMTQLARCCKPAPPDPIMGFVTRGKGVSVHRADCPNLRELVARNGDRVIEVEWGTSTPRNHASEAVYPVDVAVEAADRQGLLRDISEVLTKERLNVIGVQTQSVKGTAWMTFTVEVADTERLRAVLKVVAALPGVRSARRR